jgi:GDPmannose 4,6-dehydratase
MRALVTGAAGQDGTILCTQLMREGADVTALVKPGTDATDLLRYAPTTNLLECDLADTQGLASIIRDAQPDEVYNLGGFTAPGESWQHQDEVRVVNVDAVAAILSAVEKIPSCRMFQASSASIFEGVDRAPQTERMERIPKSPYAVSKRDAMDLVDAARDRGVHAVAGILYNHESPLRGENFVTRKITKGVARIAAGLQDVIELGDIETARDWGWAPDYVRAMQLMVRADVPHDYVLATGISHRLSFFIGKAFAAAGIEDWRDLVVSTSDNSRPVDTNLLVGDSRAAYLELGWRHTVDFDSMAAIMVGHDMALLDDPMALWAIP